MKDFLPYLPILASVVPSCLMVWIAWQQKHVAAQKLKLDLFDRRYRVFDTARKLLAAIMRNNKAENTDVMEFNLGVADAPFLFGQDVVHFLEDLRGRAYDISCLQAQMGPLPVGCERTRMVEMERKQIEWFSGRLRELAKTFAPYLGILHKG